MAEVIVNIVLRKLADLAVQEARFLHGFDDKVMSVKHELTWIQSFLKDADSRCHKSESVRCWVHEVKEVSYLIEDALDMFFVNVGGDKLPLKLIAKHKLGTAIDNIQRRISKIAERTIRYGLVGLNASSSSSTVPASSEPSVVNPVPVVPDTDENHEVIGFEADKIAILNQLLNTNIEKRSVISIVGHGGSGKTTLAKEVFRSTEVKGHFVIRLWLTISKEYKLTDILAKMLEGIGQVESEMRQRGEEYLIAKLHSFMKERRYLVVFDDVWSSVLWTQLQAALPHNKNASRVLITTRFINIGEDADATSKPYEIQALNELESQKLLLKTIFPNQYANECPEDLLPLAPQIAKKCRGLPLALVVLGGILSRKIPSYNTWDEVMRKINWNTDGSRCIAVISTSYDDLPFHLKPCFMYLAVFPEDHQIKATTLSQLWVAEGFIFSNGSIAMDDVAESYLEELAQRCMVQVSSRHISGRIKKCHIHDLLREVAIQKAKENNFLTVCSKNGIGLSDTDNCLVRRVSLHNNGNVPFEHANRNLRTLNYFGDCLIQSWTRFRMLRVLNIQGHDFDGPLNFGPRYTRNGLERITSVLNRKSTKWLKASTALRYFGFKKNYCPQDDGIPDVDRPSYANYRAFLNFSHLTRTNLIQTVNISGICIGDELPMSFWENKLLRHVIVSCCHKCKGALDGPSPSADLPNLLTLKGVNSRQEWGGTLPHFPRLRKLAMIMPGGVDPEPIVNSLSNLEDLDSLYLANESDKQLTFPCALSNERLYSLSLNDGRWPKQDTFNHGSMIFPPHLIELTLKTFHFEEDPMAQLEKLPNLMVLKINGVLATADGNPTVTCSKRGFNRLQKLAIHIHKCEEWKIERGAMPMLKKLELEMCIYLKIVPNLQYLIHLQELELKGIEDGLKSTLQRDDQFWRIKHIPSVTFY